MQSLDSAMIDGAEARRAMAYADGFGEPGLCDPQRLFIAQRYDGYSAENHASWRALYEGQIERLEKRAAGAFLSGMQRIALQRDAIPRLDEINRRLEPATGWRSCAVPGYLPAHAFFACLGQRLFPTTIVIRPADSLGYLPQPDIFHDVFGHVPLHADPFFADFLQLYGQVASSTRDPAHVERLARLFWYTVEFGLVEEAAGLRLYGSGLISSPSEAEHALSAESVVRLPFDLEAVCESPFEIDRFQPLLFVVEDFAQLRAAMQDYARRLR